jgi:hypothetical protein
MTGLERVHVCSPLTSENAIYPKYRRRALKLFTPRWGAKPQR